MTSGSPSKACFRAGRVTRGENGEGQPPVCGEAVLWIEHMGAPWHDLPRDFGKWYTVYMRFYRLTKKEVWKQIVERLCGGSGPGGVHPRQHGRPCPQRVIADRAYDADSFIGKVRALGAEAVIPTRHNLVEQREYDRHWYKNRNLVERFFNRIKQFRRADYLDFEAAAVCLD
jgi:transposase